MLDGNKELEPPDKILPALPFKDGKTLQNLSVSSPAPVTIFCPSGLIDRYNTL